MREAILLARQEQPAHAQACEIHGIDNSPAMIDKATSVINATAASANENTADNDLATNTDYALTTTDVPIKLHCEDMQQSRLSNASVVAMNFTLQFVPSADRNDMMQKIGDCLKPGGVLIISEKVTFDDPVLSEMHIDMYHNFKKANGYSALEISQKRTALENVLIPDSLDTHKRRLIQAGFSNSSVWFQCFNFASIIAIK